MYAAMRHLLNAAESGKRCSYLGKAVNTFERQSDDTSPSSLVDESKFEVIQSVPLSQKISSSEACLLEHALKLSKNEYAVWGGILPMLDNPGAVTLLNSNMAHRCLEIAPPEAFGQYSLLGFSASHLGWENGGKAAAIARHYQALAYSGLQGIEVVSSENSEVVLAATTLLLWQAPN
ncbi:uncharacterized protein PV06_11490, partial [Exophiala oligosperma]